MYKMYYNGKCQEGKGSVIHVENPATGKVIASFPSASIEQAEDALQAAAVAFPAWSHCSLNERIGWMEKLADACLAEKDTLIDLVCQEGGRPGFEAVNDEFNLLIANLHYYAEEAKRMESTGLCDYGDHGETLHSLVHAPVGVVLGHLAWNRPLRNLALKVAPAMASGCTCVLKPSTSAPLSALKFAEIVEKVGVPAGVVNIITGPSNVIGKYLNESPIPRLVSVVGSVEVGCEVIRQSSHSNIKRYSMELGGNNPAIIMPDADIDAAVQWIGTRKIRTAGQGCANVNRIFVHEDVHDEVVEKLAAFLRTVPVGWGNDMPDAMGAMMTRGSRDKVLGMIHDAVEHGAKLVCGGGIPELPEHLKEGNFLAPTLLDGVSDDMLVAQNELFAPVASVLTFRDIDDVIDRANNTEYGLCGYLFGHDSRVIGKCVRELQVGVMQVNMPNEFVNMPHIGIKSSGVGCDSGHKSLEEYYYTRRIAIRP